MPRKAAALSPSANSRLVAARVALQQMQEIDSKLAEDRAQHDPFSALQKNAFIQTESAAYIKIIVTFLLRASGHFEHTNISKKKK